MTVTRREVLLSLVGTALPTGLPSLLPAQESSTGRRPTTRSQSATATGNSDPLDVALQDANDALRRMRTDINDYTCTFVKREVVKGELQDRQYIETKIRQRRMRDGQVVVPFSVYMRFVKPTGTAGREVIYVEGQNGDKLVAHEGGTLGSFLPTVSLTPTGDTAMSGNRYPVTYVGIENLLVLMLQRCEKERQYDECNIKTYRDIELAGHTCRVLQLEHPIPRKWFQFHQSRIYVDDKLNLPIRFSAWGFPRRPGEKPPLMEDYTYLNLKLNVGLTDRDFDTRNPEYNF